MKLTPRLKTIADMVKFRSVADIGTDHGKIPIYLVENNICDCAIACDINEGPVSACKKNIINYKLENKITTRLCDGLTGLKTGECESVIIAGMGGELISKIIEESFEVVLNLNELIIQPMTGIDKLKEYLANKGLKIVEEKIVSEKDKIYVIMKVVCDKPYEISFREKYISDAILNSDSEILKKYINKLLNKLKDVIKGIRSDDELKNYNELIAFLEEKYENI